MKSEPVLLAGGTASVVALVMALIVMLNSLGLLALTAEQMDSIKSFLLPAVAVVGPIVAAIVARRYVTPVAAPKTASGEPAVLVPESQVTPAQLVSAQEASR